jgi:hypothetical protein
MRSTCLSIALVVVVGCSSSNGDTTADSDVDATGDVVTDVKTDTRHDTRPSETTPPDDGATCPAIGSTCPAGAFVGCDSDWKGVNRWECHGGRWCAEPGVPPDFSDPGCPSTVPTAGAACTPPSGPSGYQWCGYACADGTHAMVCAGGIWCGDATSSCTVIVAPDAGPDVGPDADTAPDSAPDAVADSAPDAAPDAASDAVDAPDAGDVADAADASD